MKFFAALKAAEFAAKISAAAGFDFEAAIKAGNENALKDFIANATTKAIADHSANAGLPEQVKSLEAALQSAEDENKTITGSLAAVGFTFPEAATGTTTEAQIAANKLAIEKHIKIRAQAILAQGGHPALPTGAPDTGAKKTLTRAAFNALSDREKSAFFKDGGRLTD